MKKMITTLLLCLSVNSFASNVVPIGNDNNVLYYKIGGGSDFALPPFSGTEAVRLNAHTNLGLGYSCSAFNPALSITNSLNNIKDNIDNLARDIIINATGSLIMMPMYELAKSNPTLYALLNNQLLSANQQLAFSTKSCETVREQISRGQNPYHDWGTIAVNDQWKKKLSFAAIGDEDINQAKKDIDAHSGDEGVNWTQGKQDGDGTLHAGGKGQPPVHVIADTVKAGYNATLDRDLQSNLPANPDAELAHYFATPQVAIDWITAVVGDQTITTCNSDDCKNKQGTVLGHGLLPRITSCQQDRDSCSPTISDHLAKLVTGNEIITKETLEKVSADGIAITPDVIFAIRAMDRAQQTIIINKIGQEVAIQRIIDKALTARNILASGSQVPIVAANRPAQAIIERAMANLDNDIRSLAFEAEVRKQMMSDTVSQVLSYSNQQQGRALNTMPVSNHTPLMENGAIKETVP